MLSDAELLNTQTVTEDADTAEIATASKLWFESSTIQTGAYDVSAKAVFQVSVTFAPELKLMVPVETVPN